MRGRPLRELRIICRCLGHSFVRTFFETACTRCGHVPCDRGWQNGIGVGPDKNLLEAARDDFEKAHGLDRRKELRARWPGGTPENASPTKPSDLPDGFTFDSYRPETLEHGPRTHAKSEDQEMAIEQLPHGNDIWVRNLADVDGFDAEHLTSHVEISMLPEMEL